MLFAVNGPVVLVSNYGIRDLRLRTSSSFGIP
jgi:hypothetical protein